MKNVSWYLSSLFFLVAGIGWGLWIQDRFIKPSPPGPVALAPALVANSPAAPTPGPAPVPKPVPAQSTQNMWQEYIAARQKVLQEQKGDRHNFFAASRVR
jgi:hypothetical protein